MISQWHGIGLPGAILARGLYSDNVMGLDSSERHLWPKTYTTSVQQSPVLLICTLAREPLTGLFRLPTLMPQHLPRQLVLELALIDGRHAVDE